jgi:carboxymethylenebutenolidase
MGVPASGPNYPSGLRKHKTERNIDQCAHSMLRYARARDRTGTQQVSFSVEIEPGRPKTRMVTFVCDTGNVSGFLALPRDPRRHRGIIVIHEWWGLNSWVKEQATTLAAHAYVVFALDLYQGKVVAVDSQARKLKRDLPQDRAIGELKAAFDYLACRPDVDPKRIGALGWSMGGSLALQLAIHEPRLAACVVNYGSLPTKLVDIQKINAPTLGIFAARDRGIPPVKVRAFEKSMNAAKKSVEIKIYDDAGHAFENPANAHGYRPQAANDAWLRTLMFLDQSL